MSTGDLLSIDPVELKFPLELKKQSSCSLQLGNRTDQYVAFKVKTTNPRKYCVRPNTGVISPGMFCNITVTTQGQKETPANPQCKDKFLVQSVVAPEGATTKDITAEMFNKGEGKVVEEFKLRVVYILANPPSPVPEEAEEGSPTSSAGQESGSQAASLAFEVTRSFEDAKANSSEAFTISKLTEEKTAAVQQNQELRKEMELLRKEMGKNRGGGASLVMVLLVGIIGVFLGYLMKRT